MDQDRAGELVRESIASHDRYEAISIQMHSRWLLSLSLGNGAGLLAVAGYLLNNLDEPRQTAILLPSAWLFALGLVAAGFAPSLVQGAYQRGVDSYRLARQVLQKFRAGEALHISAALEEDVMLHRDMSSTGRTVRVLEIVAAASFVLALGIPLSILTASALGYIAIPVR